MPSVPDFFVDAMTSAGLTADEAQEILDGAHLAAPAGIVTGPESARHTPRPTSVTNAYNLGLRLRASRHNGITDRSTTVPAITHETSNVLALTRNKDTWTLHGEHRRSPVHHTGTPRELAPVLATLNRDTPALAVYRDVDLHHLIDAFATFDLTDEQRTALGVLHNWRSALEHSGVGYGVNVLNLARARYATSEPHHENKLMHWARLLDFAANNEATATLALWSRLQPDMLDIGADDQAYRQQWSNPEPAKRIHESERRMAQSLASREAWAEWLNSHLANIDPAIARAEHWTGRVVSGTIHLERSGRWLVTGVSICRFRRDTDATLRLHDGTTHTVAISDISARRDGTLAVALETPGRSKVAAQIDATLTAATKTTATLAPTTPRLNAVIRAGADAARRRGVADETSWLADPSKKPTARDVPWDVLFAATAEESA